MLPPEVINRLPSVAMWIFFGVFIIGFAISRMSEAGLLGPIGRWINRKSVDHRKRWHQDPFDAPDYKAIQRRVVALEKHVRKLENEIKKLELVEEVHAAHQDMTTEYLREDAQWHIDAAMVAAEGGVELLPHRSYTRFVRDYREKHGM